MLFLTRKKGEEIQIGEATILIENIGIKYVKIGIDAPKDINIRRKELEILDKEDESTDE